MLRRLELVRRGSFSHLYIFCFALQQYYQKHYLVQYNYSLCLLIMRISCIIDFSFSTNHILKLSPSHSKLKFPLTRQSHFLNNLWTDRLVVQLLPILVFNNFFLDKLPAMFILYSINVQLQPKITSQFLHPRLTNMLLHIDGWFICV